MTDFESHAPLLHAGSVRQQTSVNRQNNSSSGSGGYDDFFGDQVVCPTCRGVGRIPHGMNQEMMALIPLSDKRLRPRRTVWYVVTAVALCLVAGGLLLFFLFPRTVSLASSNPSLRPTNIYVNVSAEILFLTITNYFNLTNNNFFSVDVTTLDVSVRYDTSIIASETNDTRLTLPMRSTRLHYITMNVTFHEEHSYIIQACRSGKAMMLLCQFRATAALEYLGKSEQSALETYQYVHCSQGLTQ